jgi:hypothetical protein
MSVENILQEVNLIATLSGILAGFAFSAVIQLLSTDRPGWLTSAVITIFSVSTLMLLYTLFTFVMIGAATAELNQEIEIWSNLGGWAFVVAFLGLLLFLAGVGLSGWIRSKATGIATSIFAAITFCMVMWVFISAIALFV